jgi:hypothetical protein
VRRHPGIPALVKLDQSLRRLPLELRERRPDGVAICARAGCAEGGSSDHSGGPAQGRRVVGWLVVQPLVGLDEPLGRGVLEHRRPRDGHVRAFEQRAGPLDQLRVVEVHAAEELLLEPELGHLLEHGDVRRPPDVDVERVGIERFHSQQGGREVRLLPLVVRRTRPSAARRGERAKIDALAVVAIRPVRRSLDCPAGTDRFGEHGGQVAFVQTEVVGVAR